MNEVLPQLLWLGHAQDGRNYRQVLDVGIQAVIELAAEEEPSRPPRGLVHCRFPLVDGIGNEVELLRLAVCTVAALLRCRIPTLVCCSAGMSRTPAITAAALALVLDSSPENCLKFVAEHHHSDVSPGLWHELTKLVSLLHSPAERSVASRVLGVLQMREVAPQQFGLNYSALLALIGTKRVIDLIGVENVLEWIGEEEARRWLAQRSQPAAAEPEAP